MKTNKMSISIEHTNIYQGNFEKFKSNVQTVYPRFGTPSTRDWGMMEELSEALTFACKCKKYDIVEYILSSYPVLASSAFATVCTNGDEKMIDLFLAKGVDVNNPDDTFSFPIIMTVSTSNVNLTKKLIRHGANLYVTDPDGLNVVDYAISVKCSELIQLFELLGLKANKSA